MARVVSELQNTPPLTAMTTLWHAVPRKPRHSPTSSNRLITLRLLCSLIAENPYWISVSVLGLIVIKAAITIPLARLFGLPWATAAETGLLLSQGGEFAFVVVGSAMTLKIFSQEIGQFMLIVTSLSMMVTPWIANLGQRIDTIIQKKQEKPIDGDLYQGIPEMQGHVIIAGAGRIGRSIIRILEAESIPYIAIDNDMDVVDEKRKAGRRVYYGDASRHGLLEHFHPETAQAIVLTMEDAHDVAGAISNIRRYWQDLPIYARARDKRIARLLHKAGATMVVAETVEVSVQLSNGLLKGIGVKEPLITRRLDIERQNALIGIRGE